MTKHGPRGRPIWRVSCIVLLLVAMQGIWALADTTPTPTAAATESVVPSVTPTETVTQTPAPPAETPTDEPATGDTPDPTPTVVASGEPRVEDEPDPTATAAATSQPGPSEPASTVTPTVNLDPTAGPTVTITVAQPTITPAVTQTVTPTPAPTVVPPSPTPSATPDLPITAHISVLIGEVVVPVGRTASSEVFASLKDVRAGVQRLELSISFDPQIVQVVDEDGDAANGVQVAVSTFFDRQGVEHNQVDNSAGKIVLILTDQGDTPVRQTDTWKRVATITWAARKAGKSVIAISPATHFVAPGGQHLPPDAVSDGVVFARPPGRIEGAIELQGRQNYGGAVVSFSLGAKHIDEGRTGGSGTFEVTTSQGEGFYTLQVSKPGYLSAEGDRPVKMTVGSVVNVGKVTLLGGDVNGDNCVDIRDVSYVAWHFDEYDTGADINGDGQIDILDLSLAAGNFGRCGPIIWEIPAQTN